MGINVGNQKQRQTFSPSDPFTDLLFNTLTGFMLLFFIAILFLNPIQKKANVKLDAQYIITTKWADNSPDDIDTWVQDPQGRITWFRDRNVGLVHLDRDDRGLLNDTITVDGETITNPLNQEVVAIRGFLPGEYIVNVHYFDSATQQPIDVNLQVARVNPVYEIVYNGTINLATKGTEKTAVRFTLNSNGDVSNINLLQKSLVKFEQ